MKRWRSLTLGIILATTGAGFGGCTETSCVARGARVTTPSGLRPIEDLRVGDDIVCVDTHTGAMLTTSITAIRSASRECILLRAGDLALRCTSDHPVYDPDAEEWAPAGDWALGVRAALSAPSPSGLRRAQISGSRVFDGVHEVFDLTVASSHHNFIADGVLVHNKSEPYYCFHEEAQTYPDADCECPDGEVGKVQCNAYRGESVCLCEEPADVSATDATGDATDIASDATDTTSDATDTTSDATDIAGDATDTTSGLSPVRFAIEVSNDVPESIYVQLNGLDGQTAWVRVVDANGAKVLLDEDCAVPDCEGSTGVCGAAQPMVQDITGGAVTGGIERTWDRTWSVIEGSGTMECERRAMAPAGDYIATFCLSLEVTLDDPSIDVTQGAPGNVVNPACVNVPFSLPADDRVVYSLLGG